MQIDPSKLLDYGISGIALFMLFYLNLQWQKIFFKANESLHKLAEKITKCQDICGLKKD